MSPEPEVEEDPEDPEDPEDQFLPSKPIKFGWYWSLVICAGAFIIFFVTVIPSYFSYPKMIKINFEHNHPGEFIGQRAELQLLELSNIGVKLAGTPGHDKAVELILGQIESVMKHVRYDLYDMEVDVQEASGEFLLWKMVTMYQNIKNVIVKLCPRNTNSTSYLLVNSHFDSAVGSPGAGDAGVMIVVMLETLRVMSMSEQRLDNPIVFLFNGAQENRLMGSHAFITKHEWAENVKAVINLDSVGSGGREILFQSGPGHPWLTRYYGEHIPHPFASTMAEELFQNNFIPSNTDFQIFRDKGVPGYDIAHSLNGYVYHTKFDRFNIIPQGTYQTTGENILALTRALANAPELKDLSKYAAGHTVFYDYLGWFMVHYTESTGVAINIIVSFMATASIEVAVYKMWREKVYEVKDIATRFTWIFRLQVLSILCAILLSLVLGMTYRLLGLEMAWFTNSWMLFGLYFCPIFFVMGIIHAFYFMRTKKKCYITLRFSVHMILYSQAIILTIITIVMTALAIRSAFFPMVGLFFYTCSLILGLICIEIFKGRKYLWFPIHLLFNIPSFLFYSYVTFVFCQVFVAMQGRDGPNSNPELFISLVVSVLAIHISGFIIPLFHFFRKSKFFFTSFLIIFLLFFLLAFTPIGDPFKEYISPKRFYVIHTNRVFYKYGGEVARNESGYYVQPVDPRDINLDDSVFKGAKPLSYTRQNCADEMYCGLPLSSTRWKHWIAYSRWVPSGRPKIQKSVRLQLKSKKTLTPTKIRFEFRVSGPDRTVMYIEPSKGVKLTDWSFIRTPLEDKAYKPPYFIFTSDLKEVIPLQFWIELERPVSNREGPTVRIALGGHLMYHEKDYTKEFKKYLENFPKWVYPTTWVATHESWLF